jgi:hypothetical protein
MRQSKLPTLPTTRIYPDVGKFIPVKNLPIEDILQKLEQGAAKLDCNSDVRYQISRRCFSRGSFTLAVTRLHQET